MNRNFDKVVSVVIVSGCMPKILVRDRKEEIVSNERREDKEDLSRRTVLAFRRRIP